MLTPHQSSLPARRAFTLVELLIVLGIIAILISLVVVVGRGVAQGAKRNATLNTLQLLDQAMAAYIASEDAAFPRVAILDTAPAANPNERILLVDGVATGDVPVNTIGYFIREASKVPRCQEILAKIPAKFLRSIDVDGAGPGTQPSLPTVFDAWDRPIRMVLPFADGVVVGPRGNASPAPTDFRDADDFFILGAPATHAFASYRRNNLTERNPAANCAVLRAADSDGGRCVGNQPYFYSVGPDGLAGLNTPSPCDDDNNTSDNVYSITPSFPK